jgi:hypothetical protein
MWTPELGKPLMFKGTSAALSEAYAGDVCHACRRDQDI